MKSILSYLSHWGDRGCGKAHELSTASFFFFFPDCEQLCRRSIKSQINSRLDGELMEGSQAFGSVRSRVSKAPLDGGKYGVRTMSKENRTQITGEI